VSTCPGAAATTVSHPASVSRAFVARPSSGHVDTVRRHVLDPLTPAQLEQLRCIGDALLTRLDLTGRMTALYAAESARDDGSRA